MQYKLCLVPLVEPMDSMDILFYSILMMIVDDVLIRTGN